MSVQSAILRVVWRGKLVGAAVISEWMPPMEELVEGCDGIELSQVKVQTWNVEGRRCKG